MKRIWLVILLVWMPYGLFAQEKGSQIVIGETSDPSVLNPWTSFSATGSYLNEYLYFSLLRMDKSSFELLPLLADGMPTVDASGRTITYHLDPEARFGSGRSITAEDVVFSLKMLKNPYLKNSHSRSTYAPIQSVVPKGENEFSFVLSEPSPHGVRVTGTFAILSKRYFDPDNLSDGISFAELAKTGQLSGQKQEILRSLGERLNVFGTSIDNYSPEAGSGPYTLAGWTRNKEVVLTYDKKFWGRRLATPKNAFFAQNFETIRIKISPDETALRSLIFNGEVDVVPSLSQALYYELSEIPKTQGLYDFHAMPGVSYTYIGLNMRPNESGRTDFFGNPLIRKAVGHLLHVDLMLQKVAYGLGERIMSDYPIGNPAMQNKDLTPMDYAPEKAKALLAAGGWMDTDGDGILDRDGQDFELSILFNNNREERRKIAEIAKEQFEKAGIKLKLEAVDFEEYLERLQTGDFDMMIGAWVQEPGEDSYYQVWHSTQFQGGSNWVGFGDPSTDKIIEEYDRILDEEKRMKMGNAIQAAIYQSQPYIFLWAPFQTVAIKKSLSDAPPLKARPGFWVSSWNL